MSFGYDRLKQSGDKGARKKTNNKWFETQDSISYWDLSKSLLNSGKYRDDCSELTANMPILIPKKSIFRSFCLKINIKIRFYYIILFFYYIFVKLKNYFLRVIILTKHRK